MPLAQFKRWVSAMACKSRLSVEIVVENHDYIARFSNGTVLIGNSETMSIKMKTNETGGESI